MDTALANGQSAVHVTITTARKRQKHLFCLTRTKPTAAILNVNKNTITGGVGAHRYLGILACKFERVVEQVADRREQRGLIGVNRQFGIDVGNRQCACPTLRLERRADFAFSDKVGKGYELMLCGRSRSSSQIG